MSDKTNDGTCGEDAAYCRHRDEQFPLSSLLDEEEPKKLPTGSQVKALPSWRKVSGSVVPFSAPSKCLITASAKRRAMRTKRIVV